MNNLLLVFLGGGLGSLARYGISEIVRNNFRSAFPVATMISNILSCLILAFAVVFLSARFSVSPALKSLIVVGFCGGFSTFSAFSFETVELFKSGNFTFAILNIVISLTVCIALIYFITKQA